MATAGSLSHGCHLSNACLRKQTIRGLSTAWWESGNTGSDAPIAILFHGFPDSPATWEAQLEILEKDYFVIRPLLRGAGESEKARKLARYRKDSMLLDHLEILSVVDPSHSRKVLVLGHDIGSVSAWELGLALGSRALGVVLVAGMGLEVFWNRRYLLSQHMRSWYVYLMQVPSLAENLFSWFGNDIVRFAYRQGGALPADGGAALWEELQSHVSGTIPHYRASLLDAVSGTPPEKRLPCPLLLIWGAKDPFLSTINSEEWKAFSAKTEIRIFNTGHWPHREKSSDVNAALERFSKSL